MNDEKWPIIIVVTDATHFCMCVWLLAEYLRQLFCLYIFISLNIIHAHAYVSSPTLLMFSSIRAVFSSTFVISSTCSNQFFIIHSSTLVLINSLLYTHLLSSCPINSSYPYTRLSSFNQFFLHPHQPGHFLVHPHHIISYHFINLIVNFLRR